ncbi:motility protein A [Cellulomonas marina]|uniref:Chemotaxis protein MotA n=1 Tax=Cellulomonas marina TaxID=988821 RepID=A0A1I1B1B6_9CELL|nr:motility protein A [Cellulomonas marina]GIG30632.1 motility protein A [Cellulomonas marina]SFB42478.1 chemotaxis protein MotA [Cellulomonas marina]
MDPAGFIGLGVGVGAIFLAMILEGGNPASIMLVPPLILVWGGTIGVGFIGNSLKDVIGAFQALPKALTNKAPDPSGTVDTIVELAERARREGLLALEEAARNIEDPFLRSGMQSAIDGTDPEDLRQLLEDRITTKKNIDKQNAKFFADLGGYAPTIGIIGTVISLVHVLENLDDPSSLGHAIAGAFVATFWGIFSANILWLPLGARIKRFAEMEWHHMELSVEGLLAVQAGANPRMVGEKLRSLLPPAPAGKDKAAA